MCLLFCSLEQSASGGLDVSFWSNVSVNLITSCTGGFYEAQHESALIKLVTWPERHLAIRPRSTLQTWWLIRSCIARSIAPQHQVGLYVSLLLALANAFQMWQNLIPADIDKITLWRAVSKDSCLTLSRQVGVKCPQSTFASVSPEL